MKEPGSLINGDLGGNLGPEAGVFHGSDLLLWVSVHMHVEHETAEGRPQVIGQVLIRHAAENEIHVQLARDFVDGEVLAVQAHPRKEVQLVPGEKESYTGLTLMETHTAGESQGGPNSHRSDRWPRELTHQHSSLACVCKLWLLYQAEKGTVQATPTVTCAYPTVWE